jgi:hypothetical protein
MTRWWKADYQQPSNPPWRGKVECGGNFFKGAINELALYGLALPKDQVSAQIATDKSDPNASRALGLVVDCTRAILPVFRKSCLGCHGS